MTIKKCIYCLNSAYVSKRYLPAICDECIIKNIQIKSNATPAYHETNVKEMC